jgi:glycosyltransferase involved in cell wall biosynthesis
MRAPKALRILHITSHLRPGGVTSYVTGVATALARRGHEVIVASGGGPMEPRLAEGDVAHWLLPLDTRAEASPPVLMAGLRMWRRLAAQPVDVIHAHTRVGQLLAWGLGRSLRRPTVATWHGFFKRRWFRRVLPCTGDLTIAISQPVAEHLRDVFQVPEARLRTILHGIDVPRFGPACAATRRETLRRSLGIPPGGAVIGTVCRLVPSKGADHLLAAFRLLHTRRPELRLLIVGEGAERLRLERLAAADGLGSAVRFVGALDDTAPALAAMDVFVFLPAVEEGFGLSLLEAMASRVPIVGIRRGQGAAWVLDQSRAGLIVPPEDLSALVAAIETLLTDRPKAQALAAQAREVVAARYSLDRMVNEIEAVYRELVAPAGRVG